MNNYLIRSQNQTLEDCILIAPNKSLTWAGLRIPSNIYIKIIKYLIKKYRIIIVGDLNDINFNVTIAENFNGYDNFFDLTGKTNFADLVNLIKKSRLIISAENGIAHLSASLMKDVYVIYTFSDPLVYSWPNNYKVYQNKKYDCMPCISLSKTPNDNYPVLCRYNFRCSDTVISDWVIKDLIKMGL